jgi:hypothetical protein
MKIHILESVQKNDQGEVSIPDNVDDPDLVEAADVVVGIDDLGTVHVLRNESDQQLEITSEVV